MSLCCDYPSPSVYRALARQRNSQIILGPLSTPRANAFILVLEHHLFEFGAGHIVSLRPINIDVIVRYMAWVAPTPRVYGLVSVLELIPPLIRGVENL